MAGGRPSNFTPATRKQILQYIKKRVPYIIAAEACGVSERSLYDWIKKGMSDLNDGLITEFSKFSQALKKIEAEKIQEHMEIIANKPERWQADAWLLERRWWKQFSAKATDVDFDERLRKLEDDQAQGEGNASEAK